MLLGILLGSHLPMMGQTWTFDNETARTLTSGSPYNFTASDGSTIMIYKAGGDCAIRENSVTFNGNSYTKYLYMGGTTKSGGSRLFTLPVSGTGTLTIIDANATNESKGKGTYKICSDEAWSNALVSSFTPSAGNNYSVVIDPGNNTSIYLGATAKGYIYEITWTPSGGGESGGGNVPEVGAPTLSNVTVGGQAVTASGTDLTYTLPYAAAETPLALAYTCSDVNATVTVTQDETPVEDGMLAVPTANDDGTASSLVYTLVATSSEDNTKSTTYTLMLQRKAADVTLKTLTVNGRNALSTWAATLASGEATFDLVATPNLNTATVKIESEGEVVKNWTGLIAPNYEQSATYTITVTDGSYSKSYDLVITRAAYLPYQTYYATELTTLLNDGYISNVTFSTKPSTNSGDTYSTDGTEGFKTVDASKTYRFSNGLTMSFDMTGASSVAILVCFRNSEKKFTLSVKDGETEVAGAPAESTVQTKNTSEVVEYGAKLDVAKTYRVSITATASDILAQVRLGLDKTLLTLTGEVTASKVAELNAADKAVTCIDLTQCTSTSVNGLDLKNTNCLVVTKPGVTLSAVVGKHVNQVVYNESTGTYTAEDIQLTDGMDFNNRQEFTASQVSYKRTFTPNTYGTFCLPYAMTVSELGLADGEVVERFGSYDAGNAQVTFVQLSAEDVLQPNTAYLIRNAAEGNEAKTFAITGSTTVPATVNGQGDYFKCNMTSFVMRADPNLYKLNSTKNQFTHSAGAAVIPAFRGYLDLSAASGAAVKPAAVRVSHTTQGTGEEGGGATSIDDALAASSVWMEEGTLHVASAEEMLVPVYRLDGRLVCWLHVQPNQPASVSLERGAYLVAGKKVAW